MGRILSRAWSDRDFKDRLLSDPRAALVEVGIAIPANIEVAILENTERTTHLVLGGARRVEP